MACHNSFDEILLQVLQDMQTLHEVARVLQRRRLRLERDQGHAARLGVIRMNEVH